MRRPGASARGCNESGLGAGSAPGGLTWTSATSNLDWPSARLERKMATLTPAMARFMIPLQEPRVRSEIHCPSYLGLGALHLTYQMRCPHVSMTLPAAVR